MATFIVRDPKFRIGDTVGAYIANRDTFDPSAGSPITSAVVDTTGGATLTGLLDDQSYFAASVSSGTWRSLRFHTPVAAAGVGPAGPPGPSAPDASAATKGIVRLSANPAVANDPVVAADTDARLSDQRVPPDASVTPAKLFGPLPGTSMAAATTAARGAVKLSTAPADPADPVAVGPNDPVFTSPPNVVIQTADVPGIAVAVPNTGMQVAGVNPSRSAITVYNDSDTLIYLTLGSTPAGSKGIRLNPSGGNYTTESYQGIVTAIHNAGVTKNVLVVEI